MANKLTHLLKSLKISIVSTCLGGLGLTLLPSCNSGFDYDPNTSTLTIVPGNIIQFGDLRPNETANQIFAEAEAFDAEGKHEKAVKRYKQLADDYPLSTKAPDSLYRVAAYHETKNKREKAFKTYQSLISDYVGTPLYQPALDRQIDIAHKSAKGVHKNRFLGIRSKVAPEVVDGMLAQILKNAPFVKTAAETAYLKGLIWENEKIDTKALANYRNVARKYPESSYAGEALFKIGNILHRQSLKGNTNLDNSKRALETFDELITIYPKHPRAAEARALKGKIAGYDVKRSLEVAQFYEKKKQYVSAIFYYNEVIKGTKAGSDIHRQAKARIAELQSGTTGR